MTYKQIVVNIVERESREALEEILEKNVRLDFGTVRLYPTDKCFQSFTVDLKELGKPMEYRVIGFISDTGNITPLHYRRKDGANLCDLLSGAEVR